MTYAIRPMTQAELPLIMSSWLRGLRRDQRLRPCDARHISNAAYFIGERERAAKLLEAYGAFGAHLPDVPEVVLGWACIGDGVLHAAFVKPGYRGEGVFKAILTHAQLLPGTITVSTLNSDVIRWRKDGRPVTFDPYR